MNEKQIARLVSILQAAWTSHLTCRIYGRGVSPV